MKAIENVKQFWDRQYYEAKRVLDYVIESPSNKIVIEQLVCQIWKQFDTGFLFSSNGSQELHEKLPVGSLDATSMEELWRCLTESIQAPKSSLGLSLLLGILTRLILEFQPDPRLHELLLSISHCPFLHTVSDDPITREFSLGLFASIFKFDFMLPIMGEILSKNLFAEDRPNITIQFYRLLIGELPPKTSILLAQWMIFYGLDELRKQRDRTAEILKLFNCVMSGLSANIQQLAVSAPPSSGKTSHSGEAEEHKSESKNESLKSLRQNRKFRQELSSPQISTVDDSVVLPVVLELVISIIFALSENSCQLDQEQQDGLISLALNCHSQTWKAKVSSAASRPAFDVLDHAVWTLACSREHHHRNTAFRFIKALTSLSSGASPGWSEFWCLTDSLGAYNRHLLSAVWNKTFDSLIETIKRPHERKPVDADELTEAFHERFKTVTFKNFRCVLELAINHENPAIFKFVIDSIISQPTSVQFLVTCGDDDVIICSLFPRLGDISLFTRIIGSRQYRSNLAQFVQAFIFSPFTTLVNQSTPKQDPLLTVQNRRSRFFQFLATHVKHYLPLAAFLDSLSDPPNPIPLEPTDVALLSDLLNRINFQFAYESRFLLTTMVLRILHESPDPSIFQLCHNKGIRQISRILAPLPISYFSHRKYQSFVVKYIETVQTGCSSKHQNQFHQYRNLIQFCLNCATDAEDSPDSLGVCRLIAVCLLIIGQDDFSVLSEIIDGINKRLIENPINKILESCDGSSIRISPEPSHSFLLFAEMVRLAKALDLPCIITQNSFENLAASLDRLTEHVSSVMSSIMLRSTEVLHSGSLSYNAWFYLQTIAQLSDILSSASIECNLGNLFEAASSKLFRHTLSLINLDQTSDQDVCVIPVVVSLVCFIQMVPQYRIRLSVDECIWLLQLPERLLRDFYNISRKWSSIPKHKDDWSLSYVLDAFTSSRWKLMSFLDLTESTEKSPIYNKIECDIYESIRTTPSLFGIVPLDSKTIFYLWVVSRLMVESRSTLPSILELLRCTVLPGLFSSNTFSVHQRQQFLLPLCKSFNYLLAELGTTSIAPNKHLLQQLADTVIGNVDVMILDICSTPPLILESCIHPILNVGHRIVGLARVFIMPWLLAIRRLLATNDRNLTQHISKFASYLVDILVYREPVIEGSNVLAEGDENLTTDERKSDLECRLDFYIPTPAYVRLSTLSFVEWVITGSENRDSELAITLATSIVIQASSRLAEIRSEMTRMKSPPLPETRFHRYQIRLWQTLCCVSSSSQFMIKMIESNNSYLYNVWGLFKCSAHPDIRHLMEVFFCRLSLSLPSMIIPLLVKGLSDFNGSIQQTSSYIIVAGCLLLSSYSPSCSSPLKPPCVLLSNDEVKTLITSLIPHCTSNGALIRGTLNSLFFDIFSCDHMLLAEGPLRWPNKFRHPHLQELLRANHCGVASIVAFVTQNKEAIKMRRRIADIFSSWDVVKEQTLLWLLPEKRDEMKSSWNDGRSEFDNSDIRVSWILETTLKNAVVEVLSAMPIYKSSEISYETEKSFHPLSRNVEQPDDSDLSYQRKFEPFQDSRSTRNSGVSRSNLIVAASLVDKLPNLAGLTRTAEVFGAERILLPSIAATRDPVFISCSVSSHLWLPIDEVPANDLPAALWKYQRQGYTIVGLEQTNNPIPLEKFIFPKKCVLVLGSEKEGTPPEVLSVIDICVEIPQKGVTRSLNVHVSGAIAIWEYTKQHC